MVFLGIGKALGQTEKGRAGKQRFRLLLGFQAAYMGGSAMLVNLLPRAIVKGSLKSYMERRRLVAKWVIQQALWVGKMSVSHQLQVWQRFQAAFIAQFAGQRLPSLYPSC